MEKMTPNKAGALITIIIGGIALFITLSKKKAGVTPEPTPVPVTYTCPICGDQFATQAELDAHIQLVHPLEPTGMLVEVEAVMVGSFSSPAPAGTTSSATAVWAKFGLVTPDAGIFYCLQAVTRTYGTISTIGLNLGLRSNTIRFMSISLPRPGLASYNLRIYDKEGGIKLFDKTYYPADIAGYY